MLLNCVDLIWYDDGPKLRMNGIFTGSGRSYAVGVVFLLIVPEYDVAV